MLGNLLDALERRIRNGCDDNRCCQEKTNYFISSATRFQCSHGDEGCELMETRFLFYLRCKSHLSARLILYRFSERAFPISFFERFAICVTFQFSVFTVWAILCFVQNRYSYFGIIKTELSLRFRRFFSVGRINSSKNEIESESFSFNKLFLGTGTRRRENKSKDGNIFHVER